MRALRRRWRERRRRIEEERSLAAQARGIRAVARERGWPQPRALVVVEPDEAISEAMTAQARRKLHGSGS